MNRYGLPALISRATGWITGKSPAMPAGDSGAPFADLYRRLRNPSGQELLDECLDTAYSCADINAKAVMNVPLRLYVTTAAGQRRPRCATRRVGKAMKDRLFANANLASRLAKAEDVEEVAEHPLLDLLNRVNAYMTRPVLFYLTDLSMEVLGDAFWWIGPMGAMPPEKILPLPAQLVTIKRGKTLDSIIEGYKLGTGANAQEFAPDEVIHLRFPSLRDLYGGGMSPLRACWEQRQIGRKLSAYENAVLDNQARPDAMMSPTEPIGRAEAGRLEDKINKKFRKGGAGGILVTESGMELKPISFPPRDVAKLATMGVTKVMLANAYGVPISLLETADVNRANAEAGHFQHRQNAVAPRLEFIAGPLNEELCPRYDERLFLAYDDPVPENRELRVAERQMYLDRGVMVINEVRAEDGLEPVPWGDKPWLPMTLSPVDESTDRGDEADDDHLDDDEDEAAA